MRKIILLVIICMISIAVSASSGRLNSEGCHNSKTEGYHCHGSPSYSTSSSYPVISQQSVTPEYETPSKKRLGGKCTSNSDCFTNNCLNSFCREVYATHFIGDGVCDEPENCKSAPEDCRACENNGKCDYVAEENCENTLDCQCSTNQVCMPSRFGAGKTGCYEIKCDDGYSDSIETSANCCLDIACPDLGSLIKDNSCNTHSKQCEIRMKMGIKVFFGILVVIIVALFYNRLKTRKKGHRE